MTDDLGRSYHTTAGIAAAATRAASEPCPSWEQVFPFGCKRPAGVTEIFKRAPVEMEHWIVARLSTHVNISCKAASSHGRRPINLPVSPRSKKKPNVLASCQGLRVRKLTY